MSVDLSVFATGEEIQVRCRDGKTRTVIAKTDNGDGPYFPHQIKGEGYSYIRSVNNQGCIYYDTTDSWDVQAILSSTSPSTNPSPEPAVQARPKPVARGYRRIDVLPEAKHGSRNYGKILWRDSSDNELTLRTWNDSDVPSCYDQWFPLSEIDFQVEEVSASLKAHREARQAWIDLGRDGSALIFTRGYLTAKGVDFIRSDFDTASALD